MGIATFGLDVSASCAFSLYTPTDDSRSCAKSPKCSSCRLYAGCYLPNKQLAGRFIPEKEIVSGFNIASTSRRGHQRFACVHATGIPFSHLLHLHLPVFTPTFPQLLTTLAFDQSRIGWFGTRYCKPIPEGLPPSILHIQTQLILYLPPFLDAACYGTHFFQSHLAANQPPTAVEFNLGDAAPSRTPHTLWASACENNA